jgi:hypothetical protein
VELWPGLANPGSIELFVLFMLTRSKYLVLFAYSKIVVENFYNPYILQERQTGYPII